MLKVNKLEKSFLFKAVAFSECSHCKVKTVREAEYNLPMPACCQFHPAMVTQSGLEVNGELYLQPHFSQPLNLNNTL